MGQKCLELITVILSMLKSHGATVCFIKPYRNPVYTGSRYGLMKFAIDNYDKKHFHIFVT